MPLWPQHAWGTRRSCAHGVEPGPGTTGASETSAAAPVCGNRRPVGLTCRLFPKRGFFMKFSGALSCEVADEAVVALVTLLPSSLKRRSIRSQHFTRLREARRRRPVRGARRCRGGVPHAPCPPPHKDRRRSWTSRCHGAGAALCRAGRGGVGPSTADACTLLQVGAELLTPWQLPSLE